MRKDINLNTVEWTDMIFEGKNKAYGAYYLRNTSARRHIAALGLTLLIMMGVVTIPSLIKVVKGSGEYFGGYETPMVMTNVDLTEKIPDENIIREVMATPPPKLKTTIQLTPPAIVDDELVDEKNLMKSQEELLSSKAQISVADVIGVDDPDAIDIADLEKHKVIMEEEEETTYITVQQMPQYPGGDAELMRYITKNIKYPTIPAENGVQGRTIIGFVVGKDGKIRDVTILRGFDSYCDKEALRVVRSMPEWIPGKQNGRVVAVRYTLPVTFKLQE